MYRKKQRGQSQKLKRLCNYLINDTREFPVIEGVYDHWHMPCREDFLNSPKTSSKIKTQAIQCMLDCAEHLYSKKPKDLGFCRIVCIITVPHIWDSQIVTFFNAKYYNQFFSRNDIF